MVGLTVSFPDFNNIEYSLWKVHKLNLIYYYFWISGQEIDFLTLLESFGYPATDLAKAIGRDIYSLRNMDKDALMDLLTTSSQKSTSQ